MLVSLGHALLMLVGTELIMVMIRVMRHRNYRTEPKMQPQKAHRPRAQKGQDVYMVPDGNGGYINVNSQGHPV